MASRVYCSSVAEELESWSERLHKLSSEIDTIPSINKYRLLPQIEQLHIIMTELDDRLCALVDSCEIVETGRVREVFSGLGGHGVGGGEEKFDYEVGG